MTEPLETGQRMDQGVERIMAAARHGAVFGEPVHHGDHTVITACEVAAGGGFGFGSGEGPAPRAEEGAGAGPSGRGSGGGGGGGSMGRPVAAIVIGPDGVRIQPIVDVTKIVLACATTWGAVALALARLNRRRRTYSE